MAPGRRNWPLVLGAAIVTLVIGMAIAGPALAPRDPLERTFALEVNGTMIGPPFPPFTSGFPLGSDRSGRDLWSRLLWAVRPTMLMVVLVAAVRLGIGVVLGVAAGWAGGARGRAADTLIAGALSVPILVVALAAIAFVGIQRGLIAFLIGLSLTGWADTARFVGTQIRLIKQQPYIEAAHALGASNTHILLHHVMRHVRPMLSVLGAFEISGAMMTTAALGFLGYYIGGGVWVTVGDFTARNVTGMPELGQMLATGRESFTLPLSLLVTGGTIFVIIMGFNLIGEGLRRQMSLERAYRPTAIGRAAGQASAWLADKAAPRGAGWSRVPARAAGLGLLGLVVAAGLVWWRVQANDGPPGREPPAPSGMTASFSRQPWAAERGNPTGSLESQATGAIAPTIAWTFEDDTGFTGGPVVAADQTVYVASEAGTLYALDATGAVRWRLTLPVAPVGTPALSDEGTIYIAGKSGTLLAVSAAGTLEWQAQSQAGREATSGPVVGQDGTIYYTLIDRVQAVSRTGQAVWLSPPIDRYTELSPRLSPAGDLVFLKDVAFNARDGSRQELRLIEDEEQQFGDPAFLVGTDGQTYYRSGHTVVQWRQGAAEIERVQTRAWDTRGLQLTLPTDAGITRDGLAWFFYAGEFSNTRVAWLDANSNVVGNLDLPLRLSRMLAIDPDGTICLCGRRGSRVECRAVRRGAESAGWRVPLDSRDEVMGGARVAGRLYVTTDGGALYAIGAE